VAVVPLTRNLRLVEAPGNILLKARGTGLPDDSVANVLQIVTVDRSVLDELVSQIGARQLALVLDGIDIVLGR
jgi:mRNA interferase MazF